MPVFVFRAMRISHNFPRSPSGSEQKKTEEEILSAAPGPGVVGCSQELLFSFFAHAILQNRPARNCNLGRGSRQNFISRARVSVVTTSNGLWEVINDVVAVSPVSRGSENALINSVLRERKRGEAREKKEDGPVLEAKAPCQEGG